MNLEDQGKYLKIIEDEFSGMKKMLDVIRDRITPYPVYTQLEFIKPLQRMIIEAFTDATDPKDEFLNNHDGGDKIEV